MPATPKLFRVILQVADLDRAAAFYARLLGDAGNRVHGSRHYFDCGGVILALLDPSGDGGKAKPNADYVYFATGELDAIHARAKELGALSRDDVHGEPAGEIVKRPWGERSFYVRDPFDNRVCFVDDTTLFTGRR